MNFDSSSPDYKERRSHEWAVIILLPRELDAIIAPIREQYDPDYSNVDSHLTLVFEFESRLSLQSISDAISSVIDSSEPIEIELDSIGDFYPDSPIIYWSVKQNTALDSLYKSLHTRLDLALPHREFIPHVTVAREISYHRVMLVKDRIVGYLPAEKFTANAVELVSPVIDRKWVSVRSFKLPQ